MYRTRNDVPMKLSVTQWQPEDRIYFNCIIWVIWESEESIEVVVGLWLRVGSTVHLNILLRTILFYWFVFIMKFKITVLYRFPSLHRHWGLLVRNQDWEKEPPHCTFSEKLVFVSRELVVPSYSEYRFSLIKQLLSCTILYNITTSIFITIIFNKICL